ncbi:MAG TPA: theronine dehydrogenase, partial [Micromonosporaceae bacterium]
MRALTVRPGVKDSLALIDMPEPPESEGAVLVDGLAIGLCGTDVEIVDAEYGEAPPGSDVLVLG